MCQFGHFSSLYLVWFSSLASAMDISSSVENCTLTKISIISTSWSSTNMAWNLSPTACMSHLSQNQSFLSTLSYESIPIWSLIFQGLNLKHGICNFGGCVKGANIYHNFQPLTSTVNKLIQQYLMHQFTCLQLKLLLCHKYPILIYHGVHCCTKVCNLYLDVSPSKSCDNRMHWTRCKLA